MGEEGRTRPEAVTRGGGGLKGGCQVRSRPAEADVLGGTVGEVPLGCILVPLKGSDSAGPLFGACGVGGFPEERGHLPLGTSGTPSTEPPPLPHGSLGSISASEFASGGRDVGMSIALKWATHGDLAFGL